MAKKIGSKFRQFMPLVWTMLVVAGIVFGATHIRQIQYIISRASGQPARLIVDAGTAVRPLPKPWQNLAQGGETPTFSLIPLASELKQLKPASIRIDHLYDFYIRVSRDRTGGLQYDFSKLDQLLAGMKSVNAIPFISLSYMPDILSSTITGAPSSWTDYQSIVQATVEHISGRNALNFTGVYYEVWNEPDLFGQWSIYPPKNYLTLYASAAAGAAAAKNVQPFYLGGPGTTKLYRNWVSALVNLCQTEQLRFDFISWHHYTARPEDFRSDIKALKEYMKNYPDLTQKLKIVISEWGPNSENDPAYDNDEAAAHLIAGITEMVPVIDKAFVFEIQDGPSPDGSAAWGRWGLYTATASGAKAKPRAQAIKLLNQLDGGQLSVTGNGTWVKAIAAKEGQTIRMLIANYDADNRNTEEVPLTVTHMSPGNYQLSKTYLSRSKTSEAVTVTGDTYQTTVPLAPNMAVLLELTPQ